MSTYAVNFQNIKGTVFPKFIGLWNYSPEYSAGQTLRLTLGNTVLGPPTEFCFLTWAS